jgi:hypothetical protein
VIAPQRNAPCQPLSEIQLNVVICRDALPQFGFELISSGRLVISVPSAILQLFVAVVNQFHKHTTLVRVDLPLLGKSFRDGASINEVSNPFPHDLFGGRSLVVDTIVRFFRPEFKPRGNYRCAVHVIKPLGPVNERDISVLVGKEFTPSRAQWALAAMDGNVGRAEDFQITGATIAKLSHALEYEELPLMYLVFEICEAFFDLTDHCCMCGKDLGVKGVKQALCPDPFCLFGFLDIGVGSSVITELHRGRAAADVVISPASVANNPLGQVKDGSADLLANALAQSPQFWNELPPVQQMTKVESDSVLIKMIGRWYYEILSRILFSNRTHLIPLPDHLKMQERARATDQFLAVISSPERELTFRQKKAQYGAFYIWHRSPATSWLSILQNGLGVRPHGRIIASFGNCYRGCLRLRRDGESMMPGFPPDGTRPARQGSDGVHDRWFEKLMGTIIFLGASGHELRHAGLDLWERLLLDGDHHPEQTHHGPLRVQVRDVPYDISFFPNLPPSRDHVPASHFQPC